MAFRGLDPLVRHRENLVLMIESNEKQIVAIESAKKPAWDTVMRWQIPGGPASRLRDCEGKTRSCAFCSGKMGLERRQAAFAALVQQSTPNEHRADSAEAIAELDASWEELQAVEAEVAKLTAENRAGLR